MSTVLRDEAHADWAGGTCNRDSASLFLFLKNDFLEADIKIKKTKNNNVFSRRSVLKQAVV